MNIFDLLIVQPIFNALLAIYGALPGHDFGIALILFTILIRLLLWPLLKKQLHQTKLMRKIQPEMKKIKEKAKGNKMLESQMMMELYRERGVKPFSSFGLLLIQLPIFIALFRVIQIMTDREEVSRFTYDFMLNMQSIEALVTGSEPLNTMFLGFVDLTQRAVSDTGIYLPLFVIAVLAGAFQYIQSKQLLPKRDSKRKLRDILKDSAAGKQVDQSEVTNIMTGRMMMFLPLILFFVALYLPGALVLYYATSSLVAIIQQYYVLSKDVDEMEEMVDKTSEKTASKKKTVESGKKKASDARAQKAQEATIVKDDTSKKQTKGKKKSSKRTSKKQEHKEE